MDVVKIRYGYVEETNCKYLSNEIKTGFSDEYVFWLEKKIIKLLTIPSVMYSLACKKIKQAKQKCIANYCRNSAGVLWESLWKYENNKIMQKTCCSGLFVDWHTFNNEEEALNSMVEELETIDRVRVED